MTCKLKAIAFDLGDTLVEYEGVPLSWEAHYPDALVNLATFLRITLSPEQIECACSVLRGYNTRLNPREKEVSFSQIMRDILQCFNRVAELDEIACATAFFRVFRQRLRCFPDVKPALQTLREKKFKIGIFTDVPYGMPRKLVLDDINGSSLSNFFDVLLTSRDVGFRKPAVATLQSVARVLACEPGEMAYVGNEKKDIVVARAFGCCSILIDRDRHGNDWEQDRTITSLSEL